MLNSYSFWNTSANLSTLVKRNIENVEVFWFDDFKLIQYSFLTKWISRLFLDILIRCRPNIRYLFPFQLSSWGYTEKQHKNILKGNFESTDLYSIITIYTFLPCHAWNFNKGVRQMVHHLSVILTNMSFYTRISMCIIWWFHVSFDLCV